jgi:ribosomal subunit interface protein
VDACDSKPPPAAARVSRSVPSQPGGGPVEIIVKGRHTDVDDRFRRQVDAKISKVEKLDPKLIRVDVEVSKERNPRQAARRERVELTIRSRGPVIRAEAAADDRYGALDRAIGKLESRLRRVSDRRKVHHGNHGQTRIATVLAAPEPPRPAAPESPPEGTGRSADEDIVPISMEGEAPVVLREKAHRARPMTVERALLEMELVGHDFYLFRDKECGHASVVYRRRGWDYGVIRLIEE